MHISLSLEEITNLSVDGHIDVELEEEVPKINELIFVDYKNIEIYGLITNFQVNNNTLYARISVVDVELKREWLDCVRSLLKVNRKEGQVLIYAMLDKLSTSHKWGDIDILLSLIDTKKESIHLIYNIVAFTSRDGIKEKLSCRKEFYNNVRSRLINRR
jgi:hypothetical protein